MTAIQAIWSTVVVIVVLILEMAYHRYYVPKNSARRLRIKRRAQRLHEERMMRFYRKGHE